MREGRSFSWRGFVVCPVWPQLEAALGVLRGVSIMLLCFVLCVRAPCLDKSCSLLSDDSTFPDSPPNNTEGLFLAREYYAASSDISC